MSANCLLLSPHRGIAALEEQGGGGVVHGKHCQNLPYQAGDDVVFGEPGDLTLLGARTLEGLNVRVDPRTKQLVDAGPAPAASTA